MTAEINQDCLAQEDLHRLLRIDKNKLAIIDVRSPEEYAAGHIAEAINIPLDTLYHHLNEIDKAKQIITVCWKGGGRYATASEIFKEHGYTKAKFLCGGTMSWIG